MYTQQALTIDISYTDVTSSEPSETIFEINWGVVLLYAVVILIIVFGNTVVVTSVMRFHFLHTVTNMFVTGVASLDLLMGLTVILEIGEHLSPNFLKGQLSCVVAQAIGCINAVPSALFLFDKECIETHSCFWWKCFDTL